MSVSTSDMIFKNSSTESFYVDQHSTLQRPTCNTGTLGGGGGGGGCNPKKTEKNRKKPVPNLKFAVAFGFFSVFFGFFRFFVVLFRFFFGLNFDKKFQSFKNHANNEVLGGQELPNNILNAYKALQMSYKL